MNLEKKLLAFWQFMIIFSNWFIKTVRYALNLNMLHFHINFSGISFFNTLLVSMGFDFKIMLIMICIFDSGSLWIPAFELNGLQC